MAADFTREGVEPYWETNPLCLDADKRCPTCDTRLDRPERPCPFSPHEVAS